MAFGLPKNPMYFTFQSGFPADPLKLHQEPILFAISARENIAFGVEEAVQDTFFCYARLTERIILPKVLVLFP